MVNVGRVIPAFGQQPCDRHVTAKKQCQTHAPMGEIGKADKGLLADTQQLVDDEIWPAGCLQGLAEDRVIKAPIRIGGKVSVRISLHYRQASAHGGGDIRRVNFQSACIGLLLAAQCSHQRSVTAPDIKHAGVGNDIVGDNLKIRAEFGHLGSPAFKKPSTMRFISGFSSRKLSWPKALDSSTKLAAAPAAFSAWTIRRDSLVG